MAVLRGMVVEIAKATGVVTMRPRWQGMEIVVDVGGTRGGERDYCCYRLKPYLT